MVSDTVPVTGAFGLVGTATVAHLAAQGRRVVATDPDTPANRKAAAALPAAVTARWADLTDPAQPGRHANPWEAVRHRWGPAEADRKGEHT